MSVLCHQLKFRNPLFLNLTKSISNKKERFCRVNLFFWLNFKRTKPKLFLKMAFPSYFDIHWFWMCHSNILQKITFKKLWTPMERIETQKIIFLKISGSVTKYNIQYNSYWMPFGSIMDFYIFHYSSDSNPYHHALHNPGQRILIDGGIIFTLRAIKI